MSNIKKTTKQFIAESIAKYGDKFTYDDVEYVNRDTVVTLTCPHHGSIRVKPAVHLASKTGCPECGKVSSINQHFMSSEQFFTKAKQLHGDLYTYLSAFTGRQETIQLQCAACGNIFYQKAQVHLQGSGCPICKRPGQRRSNYKGKRTILYILQLPNNLYKIGITNRSIKLRYKGDNTPIQNVIFEQHFFEGTDAWDAEKYLIKTFCRYKYKGVPLFKHTGINEILTLNPVYEITQYIKELQCTIV